MKPWVVIVLTTGLLLLLSAGAAFDEYVCTLDSWTLNVPFCGWGHRDYATGRCTCQPGRWGDDCTLPDATVCSGHGIPIVYKNNVPSECACAEGWHGPLCNVTDCRLDCHYDAGHGICFDRGLCKCRPGYYGSACQFAHCAVPCHNGGVCREPDRCDCDGSHDWSGPACNVPICRDLPPATVCIAPGRFRCANASLEWNGQACIDPTPTPDPNPDPDPDSTSGPNLDMRLFGAVAGIGAFVAVTTAAVKLRGGQRRQRQLPPPPPKPRPATARALMVLTTADDDRTWSDASRPLESARSAGTPTGMTDSSTTPADDPASVTCH